MCQFAEKAQQQQQQKSSKCNVLLTDNNDELLWYFLEIHNENGGRDSLGYVRSNARRRRVFMSGASAFHNQYFHNKQNKRAKSPESFPKIFTLQSFRSALSA